MSKIVAVRFDNYAKDYYYNTDLDLTIGDKVIVDVPEGLKVVTVVDNVPTTTKATKWIVDKVDMTAHNNRIAKQERIKELEKQMNDRKKDLDKLEVFRLLADKDMEMAVLFKEYSALLTQ